MKSQEVNLIKINNNWLFQSEADLEDFVWSFFPEIFDVTPFHKQYPVDKQNRCDILGISADKSLVIIELKNQVDDGIIPQLTRYYHFLLENHPFDDLVDYQKNILLVGIAPEYHEKSLIDSRYSNLEFRLIKYKIIQENESLRFELNDLDGNHLIASLPIYKSDDQQANIPSPPRTLKNLICEMDKDDIHIFLEIRSKILTFQKQIKGEIKQGFIVYSRGKNLPLAEIRYDNVRRKPFLFLYLPYSKSIGQKRISRIKAKIWLSKDRVTDIGFILNPQMSPITHSEWIQGKYSMTGEKSIIKKCMKHGVINEKDLENINTRKKLLAKYNWGRAEWGLALKIQDYQEYLQANNISGLSNEKDIFSLLDIALLEFSKKIKF